MAAANRSSVREAVVQTVFEMEFRPELAADWRTIFTRNLAEQPSGEQTETEFAEALLSAVFEHLPELQTAIEQHAPAWPFTKIARLDRAVLQVGVAELLHLPTPPAVTLNEYVEIAKNYGGDSARKFVNGVLSSLKKARGANK